MQENKSIWRNKYIVLLLIVGAVYFFLRYISPLVTPVVIAGMFLTFCYPAFDDIQKKTRIKKQYLASAILLLICTVLIVLIWLGGSLILQNLPDWVEGVDDVRRNVQGIIVQCCDSVGGLLRMNTEGLQQILTEQVDVFATNFQGQVLPKAIGESWIYVKHIASAIAVLAVTMIATILLAKDYDGILAKTGARPAGRLVLEVALNILRYIATFIKAQGIIMIAIAFVCVVALSLAKVNYALLFGILAGIMDSLPFVGTGIVLVPLTVWQLIQGNYVQAVVCIVVYVVCILIREFLEPKLIGEKVGVYPVAILLAVYAGLKLFGLWGIVKGPLALVLIKQIYEVYKRFIDGELQKDYDENRDLEVMRTEEGLASKRATSEETASEEENT